MANSLIRLFQSKLLRQGGEIFLMTLIIGTSTAIAITSNSKQGKQNTITQHSLPIKESINYSPPIPEVLLPMPIGKIDLASSKVESTRNPFQAISNLESTNLDVLNSAIKFSGIAKSGNSIVAMIKTDQGQKAYKVGDSLGNGFIIKSISSKDLTVDISNGSRNYRLSFDILKE